MKSKRWRALWIGWLFLVSACSPIALAPEQPTPVVTPVFSNQVVTPDNAVKLTELQELGIGQAGPITNLMFTPQAQTLLVVYAHEGVLRRWNLGTAVLSKTLDIYPVGLGGAAFNADGSMLVTGAGVEWEDHTLDDDYLGWQVWDVQTGEIMKREGKYYNSLLTRSLIPDIMLNHDGSWALMMRASPDKDLISLKSLSIDGVTVKQTGDAFVDFSRKPEENDFDVLAFDAQSEYFAAADEAGKVAIYTFHPPDYPRIPEAVIEEPQKDLGPRPLALAFDPRRHWLAGIRGTELVVWDLQSLGYKRQIESTLGDTAGITASLAFNPSGTLLGVGSVNGWQIWDVKSKKLVAEGQGEEVYAVTFSPDGRLFAWGDSLGVVHLWGIPNN